MMDRAEAIRILDPETRPDALAEIEYYHGFNGATAKVQAVSDACEVAVADMREQEQSQWISVKERLPELKKEVLICDINDDRKYTDVWSLEDDEDGGIVWEDKNGNWYSLHDVTHWMPLPEPPEENAAEQKIYEQVQCAVDQHNREAMRKIAAFIEPPKRVRTNADRIRAMSDEELAEGLKNLYMEEMEHSGGDIARLWCDGKAGCIDADGAIDCDDEKLTDCILRWLQQPCGGQKGQTEAENAV